MEAGRRVEAERQAAELRSSIAALKDRAAGMIDKLERQRWGQGRGDAGGLGA